MCAQTRIIVTYRSGKKRVGQKIKKHFSLRNKMKTQNLKEIFGAFKYTKNTTEESNDMIVNKGNQLHVLILATVGLIVFTQVVFDFFHQHYLQVIVNSTLLPSLLISYWFYRIEKTTLSKVWNLTHVSTLLTIQFFLQPPQSLVLTMFLPVLLSTLIVFQGKDRKLGIVLAALVFCLVIFLSIIKVNPFNTFDFYNQIEHEPVETLQLMNIVGTVFVTILEVFFLLQLNNSIHSELIIRNNEIYKNNEVLESTLQLREKMLSIVSHDLRSPMIVIESGLGFIDSDKIKPEDKKKMFLELRKRIKTTINLLDNLILWSRSQTDQLHYRPISLPVDSISAMIRNYCELHVGEKSIRFDYHFPETGNVLADKNMLDGMMRNLISNSVKFTPAGGTITVQMKAASDIWQFNVSDTGVGISPQVLEKLLKGDSHSSVGTEREQGHGLGLQLVQDFLQRHGSALEIQSEIGTGSSFSFALGAA